MPIPIDFAWGENYAMRRFSATSIMFRRGSSVTAILYFLCASLNAFNSKQLSDYQFFRTVLKYPDFNILQSSVGQDFCISNWL